MGFLQEKAFALSIYSFDRSVKDRRAVVNGLLPIVIFERPVKNANCSVMDSQAEIARAVVFLASDAASYITALDLAVDGGFVNV